MVLLADAGYQAHSGPGMVLSASHVDLHSIPVENIDAIFNLVLQIGELRLREAKLLA